ncbi:hypothetical protein [Flammeovirga aprica]|uniref:Uncharacterized protein n=1 Tax=Flammeovirga aprica JL-4 TaxID=694437 RepID=A0A7X9P1P5_9BACT|nr:hypothetical protein [Flammeovirga aprica]NME67387.1 hypothetical protein [Flammeovirga aprica JL-4]
MKYSEKELNLQLNEHLTYYSFWETPKTIPMELRGSIDAEIAEEPPIIQDYYHWGSDFTYGSLEPPNVDIIIVSKKFKEILDQFLLPFHKFYEIEVLNVEMKDKYFMLHFLDKDFYIDFKKSKFKFIKKNDNTTLKIFDQIITSQDEFYEIKRNHADIKNRTIDLVFVDNFFLEKYDFLFKAPGSNYPIVSEELKQAIINSNITGVEFSNFNTDEETIPIRFPE